MSGLIQKSLTQTLTESYLIALVFCRFLGDLQLDLTEATNRAGDSGKEAAEPLENLLELLAAQGTHFPEDQRGVNREQLRELHERLLRQLSVNTVVLVDRDRVVAGLL